MKSIILFYALLLSSVLAENKSDLGYLLYPSKISKHFMASSRFYVISDYWSKLPNQLPVINFNANGSVKCENEFLSLSGRWTVISDKVLKINEQIFALTVDRKFLLCAEGKNRDFGIRIMVKSFMTSQSENKAQQGAAANPWPRPVAFFRPLSLPSTSTRERTPDRG